MSIKPDKTLILKKLKEYKNFHTDADFARFLGISKQNLSDWKRRSTFDVSKVADCFPEINKIWLLTGEGEMLGGITPSTGAYAVSQHKGVPYYDVDFIGGFDLVFNDQTKNPTYYIDFPAYNKADAWANITGQSMEPLISHGDIIALKAIDDWQTYLLYGEVYGIITNEYRTVKKIRKSAKGEDYLRLVPLNKEYDEQDIPKSIVRGVFQIIGCAKRIF